MLETLPNVKGIIKNYFFDEKKYFEGLRRRFERFRNFHPKPKGGPQASLALAKGSLVTCTCKNFEKLKKCSKPFKTLKES